MKESRVFISYRHGDPWTTIAKRFRTRLSAVAEANHLSIFLDEESIQAGDELTGKVTAELDKTTHFVCLLCDEYWESEWCRKELHHALTRYEAGKAPVLLFVLAERMRPEFLTFDEARKKGQLNSADPRVKAVSDIVFLGPFDQYGRLVSLQWNDAFRLGDQMADLRDRVLKTL